MTSPFDGKPRLERPVEACTNCGSAVVVGHAFDGAKYVTAIQDGHILPLLEEYGADEFMADKLRRAERIIMQLRQESRDNHARILQLEGLLGDR